MKKSIIITMTHVTCGKVTAYLIALTTHGNRHQLISLHSVPRQAAQADISSQNTFPSGMNFIVQKVHSVSLADYF